MRSVLRRIISHHFQIAMLPHIAFVQRLYQQQQPDTENTPINLDPRRIHGSICFEDGLGGGAVGEDERARVNCIHRAARD